MFYSLMRSMAHEEHPISPSDMKHGNNNKPYDAQQRMTGRKDHGLFYSFHLVSPIVALKP
jgi:hypothetical protein